MLSFHFEVCLKLFISIFVGWQCPILCLFVLYADSVPWKKPYNMFLYSVINCISCHIVYSSYQYKVKTCFFFWRDSQQWTRASSFTKILDHTQGRTAIGRTPLDEWSSRRRDLYLTTHNTHNRQTSMPRGIRTHNLSRRAAPNPRLRSRGNWDRQEHAYSI